LKYSKLFNSEIKLFNSMLALMSSIKLTAGCGPLGFGGLRRPAGWPYAQIRLWFTFSFSPIHGILACNSVACLTVFPAKMGILGLLT
jgi:hypothetical protein